MMQKQKALRMIENAKENLTNLSALCRDIPEKDFFTPEIFPSNDYYGNAEQIKQFLRLPSYYPLKAVIQHGNQYGKHIWDQEFLSPLPIALAWGDHVKDAWSEHTGKKIYTIGAPFFYTNGILSAKEVALEKKRLGKNLLVFPAHSMHYSTVLYNFEKWISTVKKLKDDFDTIRICIYWKDFLLGFHKPYVDAGFECVSAGHIFDTNFLPRQSSLLEICDASISNRLGSFIGYSTYLNKPHKIFKQEVEITDHLGVGKVQDEEMQWESDPGVRHIYDVFSSLNTPVTQEHFEALEPYFGFSHIKSRNDLLEIFLLAEIYFTQN